MNPLSIHPAALLASAIASIAIGFGVGWQVNGWRLNADLEHVKAEQANAKSVQTQQALDDLVTATGKIKTAADGAQVDLSTLGHKLDLIRKDFRDANAAPLPPGCRPDAPRVRKLTAAAGTVDEAIAGQRPSGGVQAGR